MLASGRNMCMYFLLGSCKFGSSACVYSHDKTYLPPGRWWEDEEKRFVLHSISEPLGRGQNSAFMPYMLGIVDDRLAWKSAHGVEMEEVCGHWRDQAVDGVSQRCRCCAGVGCLQEQQQQKQGDQGWTWPW